MIFRKLINVLLALFLLVSNTGLSFNVHYCEDTIASITLFSNEKAFEIEKNCCGEVEEQSNCCHNKIIKSESKSDQIVLKLFSFELLESVFWVNNFTSPIFCITNFKAIKIINYCFNANAPPIFERNCQRVFYA